MRLRAPTPLPNAGQPDNTEAWQDTQPGGLWAEPAPVRRQPPLTEVLHGLDARELEGQTVFDQLFGTTPQ